MSSDKMGIAALFVLLAACDQPLPRQQATNQANVPGGVDSTSQRGLRSPIGSSPVPGALPLGQEASASASPGVASSAQGSASAVAAGGPSPGLSPAASDGPSAKLSDGQIARLLEAMIDKEIDESTVAVKRASEPSVKKLAQTVLEEQKTTRSKLRSLVDKIDLRPAPALETSNLGDDTEKSVDRIEKVAVKDFDASYVELMVRDHKNALEILDGKILPVVSQAELRQFVESEVKPKLKAHLDAADRLSKRVGTKKA